MALKPTIFKFKISLSDLNRNYYDTLNLTIAQHPSETAERMMARILAFCINAEEHLVFTAGLSAVDEPDIWRHSLDGQLDLWIDVGEPAVDRIKKARRLAQAVKVYSFNTKSNAWWSQAVDQFTKLDVSVYQFEWQNMEALTGLLQRTMDLSLTITGDSAFIAAPSGECEVHWSTLQ
ncbi:MAG: YaeQ family protein [Porticoccaceae bacterium]|nr:YaeQ family protein [Porticoccaceae bacterium]